MKKIGLAIAYDKEANCHTKTFMDCVEYSKAHFAEFRECDFRYANDHKNSAGGISAACELIEWGADVVVGHYSSLAALSAIPIYRDASVPLILPAASSCELNDAYVKNKKLFYRYQKNNFSIIHEVIKFASIHAKNSIIHFVVQNNSYGEVFVNLISKYQNITITRELPLVINPHDTFILIGYIDFVELIVEQITKYPFNHLIVLDDALSDMLVNKIHIRPNYYHGIKSHIDLQKYDKNISFWNETMLALALGVALSNKIIKNEYETYLGLQSFADDGCYKNSIVVAIDYFNNNQYSV
jgi:hypothetical protein